MQNSCCLRALPECCPRQQNSSSCFPLVACHGIIGVCSWHLEPRLAGIWGVPWGFGVGRVWLVKDSHPNVSRMGKGRKLSRHCRMCLQVMPSYPVLEELAGIWNSRELQPDDIHGHHRSLPGAAAASLSLLLFAFPGNPIRLVPMAMHRL